MKRHILFRALVLVPSLLSPAAAADDPAPGRSMHGSAFDAGPRRAAVLLGGTGVVSFPVTTRSPAAQAFVTQGIGLLHGFWYFEAERSFRQAAALDPDCAMAYWGMAIANFANEPRARAFVAEAFKRKEKVSPHERLYIDALDGFFNAINRDPAARRRDLVKKYETIAQKYPADLEAKAFLLWQLWDNQPRGVPIESMLAVNAMIGEVLAAEPRHPVLHYRIHITNPNDDPARAFPSAAASGPSAPAVPHMWHMPGHTYVDAKRYADAAWQMEAALRVEHAHMMRMHLAPDETHLFAHNRSWLIDNLDYAGRVRDAIVLCKHIIELPRHPGNHSAADARQKLLDILARHERWDELRTLENLAYCEPTEDRAEIARRLVAFGRAALSRDDRSAAVERLARLNDLTADTRRDFAAAWAAAYGPNHLAVVVAAAWAAGVTDSSVGFAANVVAVDQLLRRPTPDSLGVAGAEERSRGAVEPGLRSSTLVTLGGRLDVLRTVERSTSELRGHIALANGGAKAALDWFAKAGDIGPEVLGNAYVADGKVAKVDAVIRDTGGRVYRLANRVDQLRRMGKFDEARAAFAQLRTLAGSADLDDPPLARLAPLAASFGWPGDWRTPVADDDVGPRPPLDTLGPFRWRPWQAADWALRDGEGNLIRLADYRGKPVIVILYLGIGCVHCVEQLSTFAPKARDFAAAGIEVIAIGTDTLDTLKGSDTAGKFPFTVLSDPSRTTFQAYGAYDDFERLPLHGTILIDGMGRVRWQDIGAEPFKDPDYLLGEAKRLLKISP